MKNADYAASAAQFVSEPPNSILGALSSHTFFDVALEQRDAWNSIIDNLKGVLVPIPDAFVCLEFVIPRMGRRVDALLLFRGCVFVVEYKEGSKFFLADIDQVLGYALDLKNFHETSKDLPIVPILVAMRAKPSPYALTMGRDNVADVSCVNGDQLLEVILAAADQFGRHDIDPPEWASGRYKPTPTIIEAAQALYRNHRVDEITRNEAGAENLSATGGYVSSVVESAKAYRRKAICFVTGVPGSGKTLAGLNLATLRAQASEAEHAVFLSGNGPLVKVLRTALIRDHQARVKTEGRKLQQREAASRSVNQFVQNIHHFRDDNLRSKAPPIEKVVVFDKAQRAWDKKKASEFMRQKRKLSDFGESEPEFLLSVMDRHADWCVVVCLVGNGQEINTGEAGISEWINALESRFPHWEVHLSDRLVVAPHAFGLEHAPAYTRTESSLHLSTAIRSFRSERVSDFASAIIDGNPSRAAELHSSLGQYPLGLTRSIRLGVTQQ